MTLHPSHLPLPPLTDFIRYRAIHGSALVSTSGSIQRSPALTSSPLEETGTASDPTSQPAVMQLQISLVQLIWAPWSLENPNTSPLIRGLEGAFWLWGEAQARQCLFFWHCSWVHRSDNIWKRGRPKHKPMPPHLNHCCCCSDHYLPWWGIPMCEWVQESTLDNHH